LFGVALSSLRSARSKKLVSHSQVSLSGINAASLPL
jgi:hypothetical protein